MGRAALNYAKNGAASSRHKLVSQLGDALRILLPLSKEEDIFKVTEKTVDKAIELKNTMTQEQALYHCFCPESGQIFNDFYVEVSDEEQAGTVLACTFPGLARTIKKDDKELHVVVVKASAVLESTFVVKQ